MKTWRFSCRDLFRLCAAVWLGLMLSACSQTLATTPVSTAMPTRTSTATPTEMPVPTPTPYVTVLSPNGGEEWVEGQTYRILWSSAGVEQVSIAVASGGKDKGHIVFEVQAQTGEYAWTIPQGFISGFGESRSDSMRIRVYDANNPDLYDENDGYFAVVAP